MKPVHNQFVKLIILINGNENRPTLIRGLRMKYFFSIAFAMVMCACSSHSSSKNISNVWSNANGSYNFSIHTNDDKVILGINDSTVYMQLSKEMLNHMNRDLSNDTNKSQDDWAGEFSNFVKSHVRELINRKLEYNLEDIKSVTYDDGGLVFDYKHKHLFSFERIIDEDKPALKCFNRQDAESFITHFNALKKLKN